MRLQTSTAIVALTLASMPLPANAADIAVTSKLDAVTVYRSGAQVSRLINQEIDAGMHTLVIKDLPAQAIARSIRVEGTANGGLQIGAVDTKRVSVLSDDADARSEKRRGLEDELEKLSDAMDQLNAEIATKEAQKTFVANLANLPQQPPMLPRGGAAPDHDWAQLLTLIGSSMSNIQKDILETRIAMRALSRRIEDTKKQIAALAPKQVQRTEVRINVEADTKLKADLVVRYQVGNASWRPHYDARLNSGSKETPASVTLTRRAAIQQYTGEAWNNVQLKLSTSQPSGKSSAPTLTPMTVDFRRPRAQPVASAEVYQDRAERDTLGGTRGMLAQAPPAPKIAMARATKPRAIAERRGRLEQTAFQASFVVPGRVTVANRGEAKRVKLDDQTIKPELNIRTVPRHDTNAYLYAKLELPTTAPYLAGPVSLFRDGGFVGTGRLPNLAPGADHELGFGSDPSVTVKYHIQKEKRGESGIISSSSTDQRNFKIDITNQHARRINIRVIDQMPVSLNEDIEVELIGASQPTKRNFEDKRGVLAWEFGLDAGAKRSLNFGYTIEWPADKKVQFGYRR